jgi:hypothetical protein
MLEQECRPPRFPSQCAWSKKSGNNEEGSITYIK